MNTCSPTRQPTAAVLVLDCHRPPLAQLTMGLARSGLAVYACLGGAEKQYEALADDLMAWAIRRRLALDIIDLDPRSVPAARAVIEAIGEGAVPLRVLVVTYDKALERTIGCTDLPLTVQPVIALAIEEMRSHNGGLLVQLTSDHTVRISEVPAKRNVLRCDKRRISDDSRDFFEHPGDWVLPWHFSTSGACHNDNINRRTYCV